MKVFIYSDLHISRTSSIMPNISDSMYTFRQKMIIETGKFLASIIEQEQPDIIINCGDTFDQSTITSYDVHTASEFFKCFEKFDIPHMVLVGNHDMVNSYYNAVTLLSNIPNITVVSEPCSLDFNVYTKNEQLKMAFLPYCNYKDILKFPEGDVLFSHQDIQGSIIRGDFALPDGIAQEQLKQYKVVFNGHIHKSSVIGNIVNVGSITTHSFSDDNDNVPQCYIFDTDTMDLKTFKSTVCPLFRKLNAISIDELKSNINCLESNYKYITQVTCPFEIKDEVKEYLTHNENILNFRILTKVNNITESTVQDTSSVEINTNIDVKKSFESFLDTVDLKVPKDIYLNVLGEI